MKTLKLHLQAYSLSLPPTSLQFSLESTLTTTRLTFNIHKRFFTAKPLDKSTPTTNTTTSQYAAASSSSFTVDYLTNSCGFSLKSAISASKTVNLVEDNKQHYDSVVNFLKSNEFSETQVVKLVKKYPVVLSSRISTTLLQPMFQFFTENGVSSSVLPKIFVSCPNIMFSSVDAQLRPVMQFLRKYITCHDKFEVAILRGSCIFTCKNRLMPNVEFLIQQGVPKNRIGHMLVAYPKCLFYPRLEKIASAIDRIRVMGVKPSDNKFIRSLCAVLSLSELSWKKKVEVFESMGWSYDEVVSMFVRCLCYSEKKLRDIMDFFVNTVKTDPKIIISYPKIFTYSLEKRIVPRYTVWKMLTDQGLIQKTGFVQLVSRSEKFFTKSYIKRFSTEIPDLQSIYDQSKK